MTDPNRDTPIPNGVETKSSEPSTIADIPEHPKATPEISNGAQDSQVLVQALTDRALHFLATASNETLGACLVGLGVITYLVLGRIGLVLIGVVGGVVLHATWEGNTNNNGDDRARGEEVRRRETGLDVAHRVLDWRTTVAQSKEGGLYGDSSMDVKLCSGKNLDYAEFRPETASALNELTNAVIRDYVRYAFSLPESLDVWLMNSQVVVFSNTPDRVILSIRLPSNINCVHPLSLCAPLSQKAGRYLPRLCHKFILDIDCILQRTVQCFGSFSNNFRF